MANKTTKTEETAGLPVPVPAPAETAVIPPPAAGAVLKVEKAAPAAAAAMATTKTRVSEGVEKAMKTAEEFVAFGQGNLEALVKSGQIWAAGLQDLSKQVAATAQGQFEETLTAFKAITGARSVKDAFDVQTGYARSTLEKTIAETGKLTESSVKLAEQAMAPITARMALAVEKFGRPAV